MDLVVETVGGSGDWVLGTTRSVLESGKHLVTANKALLAAHGDELLEVAREHGKSVGYEAAVCAAIPIIRGLTDGLTGDEIVSISGIMNGTSNYVLSKMASEGQSLLSGTLR